MRGDGDEGRTNGGIEAAFACANCRQMICAQAYGTEHRNHCPRCLWSLHVDLQTGDRRSGCQGPMEPIAVWVRYKGEWSLVHRCKSCGMIRANRIAGDDNEIALISIAVRPLAAPPFPLDRLERAVPQADGDFGEERSNREEP